MIKNNYHTHTRYCGHAKGEVEDYVKQAVKLNMQELGFSDHAPIPLNHGMTDSEWEENYCYENMDMATFDKYLDDVIIPASYSGRHNSEIYLFLLLSGISGKVLFKFSIYSSLKFIGNKSGSGKYL